MEKKDGAVQSPEAIHRKSDWKITNLARNFRNRWSAGCYLGCHPVLCSHFHEVFFDMHDSPSEPAFAYSPRSAWAARIHQSIRFVAFDLFRLVNLRFSFNGGPTEVTLDRC